jgi:hypothetical protein
LRPYERNPRTHSETQVDQIAASMVEFGWTNPVLVDEQGGVLAGHGRLLAAHNLATRPPQAASPCRPPRSAPTLAPRTGSAQAQP